MKASTLAKSLEPLVAAGLSSPWWKDDRARHCAYCGIKMRMKADGKTPTSPTRDHLVPSSHDGPALTVPACLDCNRAKGAKSLPEFMAGDYFTEKRTPGTAGRGPSRSSGLSMPSPCCAGPMN